MNRRHLACMGAFAVSLVAGGAHAQQLVYDPTAYAKLLEQAQTQLRQLEQLKTQVDQGRQLLSSLDQASGVNGLATDLSSPALRAVLPDAATYAKAAKGDLSALGQIGSRASQIRSENRLYAPPAGDARGQDLETAGDRAARDLALGQTVTDAGARRLVGLQQLQGALDGAPNARAVLDIQARLAAEQAMISHDQMRLHGLAMSQGAEDRLARQRQDERAAADNAARLKLYQQGFQ